MLSCFFHLSSKFNKQKLVQDLEHCNADILGDRIIFLETII